MSNPLLTKIKLPGRIFQLPSKGIFYGPGVLSEQAKTGEVQVMPLSALAEMKLRAPDLLFSGRVMQEICAECIPDILKPELLVSKDVDAIFCFLRIATYGAEMKFRSVHECKNSKPHDYMANIEAMIANPNNGILDHASTLYDLDLSNGQKVKLKPVIFQDSIDMTHLQMQIEKELSATGQADQKLIEKAMIRDLISVIAEVDGITDRNLIEDWIKAIPKKFFAEIIERSRQCNEWGINLNVTLKCKDCGAEYEHSLELDPVNFFSG